MKHSVYILPIPECASRPLDILFNNHVLSVVRVSSHSIVWVRECISQQVAHTFKRVTKLIHIERVKGVVKREAKSNDVKEW